MSYVRFSESQRRYSQGGPFYHVCTKALETDIYFRNKEEMDQALNIIAIAVFASGCKMLAFAIMSNHFHFVLEGSIDQCVLFFEQFHAKLEVLMKTLGRKSLSDDCEPKYISVKDLYQLKDLIAYVVRNPFVAMRDVNMFSYRWCSGYLYFNHMLANFPKGERVSEMSLAKRRAFSKSRTGEVDNRILAVDGIACASCFVDYKRTESFFDDARDFQHWLLKNVDSQVEIATLTGDKITLDDHEMWEVVYRQCKKEYGVSGPKELTQENKLSLARTLKQKYCATNAQISRCLGMMLTLVNQLFPLAAKDNK